MRSAAVVSLLVVSQAFPLPDGMLGTWTPQVAPHAILGPNRFIQHITVAKDDENGDFWFSAIDGQDFRVSNSTNEMQYCFSGGADPDKGSEEAPFYTHDASDTKVDFCWRGKPMTTHKAGCQACDCAKITLELKSNDTMHFTFWMSPPVIHAHTEVKLTGPAPNISFYKSFLGDRICEFQNRTGFMPTENSEQPVPRPMQTCPVLSKVKKLKKSHLARAESSADGNGTCRQLDGLNFFWDPVNVPDIRLQYKQPLQSCWPCDVQYSVSAAISENQYIALGFKGMGYAIDLYDTAIRPNYFGMATDALERNRTGTAIAVGHGQCVREMRSDNYVGSVVDVTDDQQLSRTSIEQRNGRTIVRFTVSQHVGRNLPEITDFFGNPQQNSARVMWAIGNVSDTSQCNATLSYHQHMRGVAPLNWLSVGSTDCKYDPSEIDPPTPPSPSPPAPAGCPGGSYASCIHLCPSDPEEFQECMAECHKRCDETAFLV